MTASTCDLFVIGAGSGGVRAARMAAQRGLSVVVAENAALGGTCVNLGCIPKKLYSFAAHYREHFDEARGFGWSESRSAFDWATLKRNRAAEIARLNGIYASLLADAGAGVVRARACILRPGAVEAAGRTYEARHIVVATGSRPVPADIPGGDLAVSSDAMFDLPAFPQRLVVVGGGYIACEFASIFQGLGSEVTLLYRGEQVLRGFDHEVRAFVGAEMRKKGVDVRTGSKPSSLQREGRRIAVRVDDAGEAIVADTVLYATGRVPNTSGLGLEEAGVALDPAGAVLVDDHYRSNVAGIFAVGDVIDRVQLTPVAIAEAMAVVESITGGVPRAIDYAHIPTAVFTHPNIGTIGLSEEAARARFDRVTVFRAEFKALRHTLSGSDERTFMKLVVDAATDRVVGLHMVGADAGETIQGFAVAMKAGATKAVFDATLGIHPTVAEEFVTMRTPAVAS